MNIFTLLVVSMSAAGAVLISSFLGGLFAIDPWIVAFPLIIPYIGWFFLPWWRRSAHHIGDIPHVAFLLLLTTVVAYASEITHRLSGIPLPALLMCAGLVAVALVAALAWWMSRSKANSDS